MIWSMAEKMACAILAGVPVIEKPGEQTAWITSDSTNLGVMSRTYDVSQADTLGTFGQAIPGIPADHLIGDDDSFVASIELAEDEDQAGRDDGRSANGYQHPCCKLKLADLRCKECYARTRR